MHRPLATLLALGAALAAQGAVAQDMGGARALLADIAGTWAEPGLDCAQPADTWVFNAEAVIAGRTRLDLLGIGGSGTGLRLDLVSRNSGMRVPLALTPAGEMLQIRGSGISADLRRCGSGGADAPILAEPLGGDPAIPQQDLGPTTEELRAALGERSAGGATATATESVETAVEEEVGAAAERRFAAEISGGWRGTDGTCSWQFGDRTISADGTVYEVVSFSGSPERIGVQALDPEGTPATFTIVPDGAGSARVTGARPDREAVAATLSRC